MNIIWTIDQVRRNVETGGIVSVDWRCTASEREVSVGAIGVVQFSPDPESPDFIPFDQLTEEILVGWVKDSLGAQQVAVIEEKLVPEAQQLLNPQVVQGLPWQVQ